MPRLTKPHIRIAAAVLIALALALTFMAYLNPSLVVDLANRVWACF